MRQRFFTRRNQKSLNVSRQPRGICFSGRTRCACAKEPGRLPFRCCHAADATNHLPLSGSAPVYRQTLISRPANLRASPLPSSLKCALQGVYLLHGCVPLVSEGTALGAQMDVCCIAGGISISRFRCCLCMLGLRNAGRGLWRSLIPAERVHRTSITPFLLHNQRPLADYESTVSFVRTRHYPYQEMKSRRARRLLSHLSIYPSFHHNHRINMQPVRTSSSSRGRIRDTEC